MTTEPQVRYFLGSNSPKGFYSLHHQLLDPAEAECVFILKGGPGCGKTHLMKRVAEHAEASGLSVEYIACAGDPESLDAIRIPGKKAAVIDGTAPHVVEPKYPGLIEHYVNLERFYDPKGLAPLRGEIMERAGDMKNCYNRAFRCLRAASEIEQDIRSVLLTQTLEERMMKRARGIAVRELKSSGKGRQTKPGAVRQRFLSGITHAGTVCFFETADAQCKRVYELSDSYGLAHLMLSSLLTSAVEAGYDVVACPSPTAPDRLEHLLIPDLSLAFVTSSAAMPYGRRPARHIRLDAMADGELLRRCKPKLRFSKKISAALTEEVVTSLKQAKTAYDALEELYKPHMDFDGVRETAEELSEKLLK